MKKLFIGFSCTALFAACQKSESSLQQSPGGKLVSVTQYTGAAITGVDTFIYNANGDIQTQREWVYTPGTTTRDSFTIAFSYAGNNKMPASYTITDGWGVNSYTLSYDNQGRLVKDTLSPDPRAVSSSFFYPGNNIVYNSAGNGSTDTLFFLGNNMVKVSQADIPFNPLYYDVTTFTYTGNYPNPFYSVGQSANLRLLLFKINAWESHPYDFISQQAPTTIHDNSGNNASVTHTTDPATGRVIKTAWANYSATFRYR